MNTFKTSVGGIQLTVNEQLRDWGISKPTSTMIAFIAVNSLEQKLFLQWANGTGNFYSDVDMLTLIGIVTAPSAGKFFHSSVKDKFESEKVATPLISLAPFDDGTDDVLDGYPMDEDEEDFFFGGI